MPVVLTSQAFQERYQIGSIGRGLTQEKLAEILEVKPQQVQRDEANLYAGASFSKLLAIQKALHLEIKPKVIFQEC